MRIEARNVTLRASGAFRGLGLWRSGAPHSASGVSLGRRCRPRYGGRPGRGVLVRCVQRADFRSGRHYIEIRSERTARTACRGLRRRDGGRGPAPSFAGLALDAVEDSREDDEGTEEGEGRQRVAEEDEREDDGEHLARGHDDGEDDGPKRLDGVEDEELPRGRRDGDGDVVEDGGGVLRQERQSDRQLARHDQRAERHHDGPRVDGEHHLELVHGRVGLVEARLPLRRERVGDNVQRQHQKALHHHGAVRRRRRLEEARAGVRLAGVGVGQREDADAKGDCGGFAVVDARVNLLVEKLAHEHHGDDLRRFGDGLQRERHVAQRLVLAKGRERVRQRARRKCKVRRRNRQPPAVLHQRDHACRHHRQHAVREHAKRRAREPARRILASHDLLLDVAPRQVRRLQADEAEDELLGARDLFAHGLLFLRGLELVEQGFLLFAGLVLGVRRRALVVRIAIVADVVVAVRPATP
mmetsp:Transcript_20608/g.73322  ORF Transcript_20608/g.73322 Transcript_20608/m.73322 type:complete len:470 (+) Transcript_20608:1422-2831(+)